MRVFITKLFVKQYERVPLPIQKVVDLFYNQLLNSTDIRSLPHIKKLQGYDQYYRFRVGSYRLGFKKEEDAITFLVLLHRKDVYRQFP